MSTEFVIDSNPEYFEKWLRDFHSRYSPSLIELEPNQKWLAIFRGPLRTSQSHLGYVTLEIKAHIQTRIDEDSAMASHEFPVISFRLLPLSANRVQIEAECKDSRLQNYFDYILKKIAKLWPEGQGHNDQILSSEKAPRSSLNDEPIRLGGGHSEEILVLLDVLDVSVSRRIEGYTAKLATAERDEIVPGGRIIYRLSWRELGRIGEVELHKSDQNATWLTVRYVRPVDEGLSEQIKKHMDLVIRALRSGLAEDGIWEKHEQELKRREKEKKSTAQPASKGIVEDSVDNKKKTGADQGEELNLQTRPAGRPPDRDYDEAFRRIRQGEDEKDVFEWFCRKKGWSKPGKAERDSFKQAIKRRRKVHNGT